MSTPACQFEAAPLSHSTELFQVCAEEVTDNQTHFPYSGMQASWQLRRTHEQREVSREGGGG